MTTRARWRNARQGVLAWVGLLLLSPAVASAKPRLLVTTDIGGDPDDQQSMRRLMLYANEVEIVGLVASASGTPGEVGAAVTRPDLIRAIVDDYGAVCGNLMRHAAGYPTAAALAAVIKSGNPDRGVAHVGAGHSTEGSRHIIACVDASDSPLYVAIWGGATDLAQALSDVNASRSADATAAFIAKLRVYAIADQDKTRDAQGTGEWIRAHFPSLRYVEAGPPQINGFTALFRGLYQNDSAGGGRPTIPLVADGVAPLDQAAWLTDNIRVGHGALGAGYPVVVQNPPTARNTSGVKEGDTPSWFYVLPNGLQDPEEPTWGGWGGRFRAAEGDHFIDAEDAHGSGLPDVALRRKWTVARWREAYQNDFAARMDWCVQPYASANHAPVAAIDGDTSRAIIRRTVTAGQTVTLDASASRDPDGNPIVFAWFNYREAGTFEGPVTLSGADTPGVCLVAPAVDSPRTVHLVLTVADAGRPALAGYRRVVLTIIPVNK